MSVPHSERVSRVATASSLYMRKTSLDCFENPALDKPCGQSRRRSTYGKIIKNVGRDQIQQSPMCSSTQQPNLVFTIDRKHLAQNDVPGPVKKMALFESNRQENQRIKMIQAKYSEMLLEYEKKKSAILTELSSLDANRSLVLGHKRTPTTGKIQQANPTPVKTFQPVRSCKKENWKLESRPAQKQTDGIASTSLTDSSKHTRTYTFAESEKAQDSQGVREKRQREAPLIVKNKLSLINESPTKGPARLRKDTHFTFFRAMKQMIECEERLRILKQSINESQREEIRKILEQKQVGDPQDLVNITPSEVDPFLRVGADGTADSIAQELVDAFEHCQSKWNQLKNTLTDKTEAIQVFRTLNFEGSLEISLKSLVREVSFNLEKHYRNRDLHRIYQRLSPLTAKNFLCLFGGGRQ